MQDTIRLIQNPSLVDGRMQSGNTRGSQLTAALNEKGPILRITSSMPNWYMDFNLDSIRKGDERGALRGIWPNANSVSVKMKYDAETGLCSVGVPQRPQFWLVFNVHALMDSLEMRDS